MPTLVEIREQIAEGKLTLEEADRLIEQIVDKWNPTPWPGWVQEWYRGRLDRERAERRARAF